MTIPPRLLIHTATVRPHAGAGAYGDLYGPEFTIPCYVEWRRSLVRDADGEEVVAQGVLYADPVEIPADSIVTALGREARVVAVSLFNDDELTRLSHVEVALA